MGALFGDSPVHRQRAEEGQETMKKVAMGESAPAARAAMPGM